MVIYLTFSRATVILKPSTTEKTASAQITIDTSKTEIDLENSVIPGTLVVQEFEKSYSDIPIESKSVNNKAGGKITIYNNQDKQQYLLVESQITGEKDSGIVFMTDKAITIPANSKVDMTITAKDPGSKGNIYAQKFNFIKLSPSMQKLVYAESAEPMQGGIDQGTVLSQDDIQEAIKKYQDDFFTTLRTDVLKSLGNSSKAIRKELSKEEIIESSPNVPIGTSASKFDLKIKGRLTAIALNENNVLSIASATLKSKASDKEEFVKYDSVSLKYSEISADWNNAKAAARIELSGSFISSLSPSLFEKERLIGMTKDEAINYLKTTFPEIGSAEIQFWPPWNSTIPGGLKSNIRVEVRNEF